MGRWTERFIEKEIKMPNKNKKGHSIKIKEIWIETMENSIQLEKKLTI